MKSYFTPVINCEEIPATEANQDFARLFRFHIPYAKSSYFLNRKISVSRQHVYRKKYGIEFYQGVAMDEVFVTLRFNHANPVLIIALVGDITLTNRHDKTLEQLHQGECVLAFWPVAEYRVISTNSKKKLLLLSLNPNWFSTTFKDFPYLVYPYTNRNGGNTTLAVCRLKFTQWRLILRLLTEQRRNDAALGNFLKETITKILLHYERSLREKQMPHQQRINKITEYILLSIHQYRQIPDISQVADKFGFTRRSLERTCREVTGLAPIQFINNLRLAEGRLMLADTDKSVKEIADLLLYNSHSHFTSAFHRQFGIKPTAFREMQRTGLSNLGSANRLKNRA